MCRPTRVRAKIEVVRHSSSIYLIVLSWLKSICIGKKSGLTQLFVSHFISILKSSYLDIITVKENAV